MNVAKIHRKLMSTESQFYFANISATKAWILMKFYVVVNYYLVSLSIKLYDDPCINVRTCDKTCARAFTTRACAYMDESS